MENTAASTKAQVLDLGKMQEQSRQNAMADKEHMVSAAALQGLRKEFEQFKDNQFSQRTDQQAHSLLEQMVEKLGHLVEQQTKFFGNILPKLLEQQTTCPLLPQKVEQQETKEDTKQQRNSIPTKEPWKTPGVLPNLREANTAAVKEILGDNGDCINQRKEIEKDTDQQRISIPTREPCKTPGVLPNLRQVNTAAVKEIPGDDSDSRNPQQHTFSGVSGAEADGMGLNANTEPQEARTESTTFLNFDYVRDDYARRSMLVDFLRSHESAKGNVIIYVSSSTGEHRLNSLIDLLQEAGFGNLDHSFQIFHIFQPHQAG